AKSVRGHSGKVDRQNDIPLGRGGGECRVYASQRTALGKNVLHEFSGPGVTRIALAGTDNPDLPRNRAGDPEGMLNQGRPGREPQQGLVLPHPLALSTCKNECSDVRLDGMRRILAVGRSEER